MVRIRQREKFRERLDNSRRNEDGHSSPASSVEYLSVVGPLSLRHFTIDSGVVLRGGKGEYITHHLTVHLLSSCVSLRAPHVFWGAHFYTLPRHLRTIRDGNAESNKSPINRDRMILTFYFTFTHSDSFPMNHLDII